MLVGIGLHCESGARFSLGESESDLFFAVANVSNDMTEQR